MAARIYTEKDADLRWLKGKTCAVIGFGSQGRAQALNLKDSHVDVIVGLYPASKSRHLARSTGLRVFDTAEAVPRAEIIFLALSDTRLPDIFKRDIASHLRRGQTLLVAHGFAIHYGTITPPPDVDVIMVAPKALGPMVRREYLSGRGVPALIAIHQNVSGHAKKTALAWAKAIGCTRAGVIETTFAMETETDLFGEQAVLCGGVTELIRAAFDTLVSAGYPAELAYFECLHELKFIVDLIHEEGMAGMNSLISDTALWGELTVGPKIVDTKTRRRMESALRDIRAGKFARNFIRELNSGRKRYSKLLKAADRHPIEKVGRRLRDQMIWRKKKQ
ncbi:MAG: ilvC, partial [Spartobacteria bacterium]|nr:ilvC [Spartobacteria bacterium]